jgi:hypothetical protein
MPKYFILNNRLFPFSKGSKYTRIYMPQVQWYEEAVPLSWTKHVCIPNHANADYFSLSEQPLFPVKKSELDNRQISERLGFTPNMTWKTYRY